MSRCCRKGYGYGPMSPYGMSPYGVSPYGAGVAGAGYGTDCGCGSTYGGCNFACFIILILILLTFNNNRKNCCNDGVNDGGFFNNDNYGTVGKGILFVIALYYLSCWVPCARGGGGY